MQPSTNVSIHEHKYSLCIVGTKFYGNLSRGKTISILVLFFFFHFQLSNDFQSSLNDIVVKTEGIHCPLTIWKQYATQSLKSFYLKKLKFFNYISSTEFLGRQLHFWKHVFTKTRCRKVQK